MSEGMGASAPAVNSVVPSSVTKAAHTDSKGPTPHAKKEFRATDQQPKSVDSSAPSEPKQPTTKHKVKIDGREEEVELEKLIANYQKAQAADRRFQEAARKEKEAQSVMQALESGDLKFLEQKLGKAKAKALMEDYLIQDMEYEALPESEKRARQLEQENKTLKQQQEELQKAEKQKKYEAELSAAQQEIDNEVHQALAELGMKPTPRLAVRIVDEMIAKLEGKQEAISAKQASERALQALQMDIGEYLPTLTLEQLQKIIPPKVIDMLRQGEVDRVLGDRAQRRSKPSLKSAPTKPQKPVGIDDYFKQLEQKLNKKK